MRTFIALDLPPDVIERVVQWQQANLPPNVYPEPATNLHMTLGFLGETQEELIPQIREAIDGAIADVGGLDSVILSGPSSYKEVPKASFLVMNESGGQALWAALNQRLFNLMGYMPQFSPWLAHITVWKYPQGQQPNFQPTDLPDLGSFAPTGAGLYQSVSNAPEWGATYQKVANILDPIQPELDQTVFRGTDLREFHRLFIMRLYQRALRQEFGVTGEGWADLYLTGSLTTYQYSETSDADVSVFANWNRFWEELGIQPDEARKRLIALSIEHIDGTFLPGTTHPLQFFVVPSGTLPSDLYQPGLRSAYSLDDDMWFQEPERDRAHDIATEMPDVFQRAVDIADKMREMLDHDPEQARQLWHDIHKKRQLDQRAGLGDFCEGNVVYKYLLNQGLFDRIKNELGEYIAKTGARPENYDPWENGGVPPYALQDIAYPEGLAEHVRELLKRHQIRPDWMSGTSGWAFYEGTPYVPGSPEAIGLGVDRIIIPPVKDIMTYAIALHEIAHILYRRKFNQPGMENSVEEESWAWAWILENSEIVIDEGTLNRMHEMWQTYDKDPSTRTYSPYGLSEPWFRWPPDFKRPHEAAAWAEDSWSPTMPMDVEQKFVRAMECPWDGSHLKQSEQGVYCPYCGWQPREKLAADWLEAVAPWAAGIALMAPMVNTPEAEAAPAANPQIEQVQQGKINNATITRALSDMAGRPITFRTEDGSKDGSYGWADWEKNLVVIDWRLASRLYELPKVNPDPFYGTDTALATLAHELGHVILKENRSEYAATRVGCNRLDGLLTRLGIKNPLKQKLVAAAWKNLNAEYGCRNRRDLGKTGYIDPEDAYFFEEDDEENPVRRHEFWHTFWIDLNEIFDNGQRVYVMVNPDEVDVGDPVTVKWESGSGRMKADGVLEYLVDPVLADDAFEKNQPISDWASIIRIDLDSMQPVVYAKVAATTVYHVAPRLARDNIKQNGLNWQIAGDLAPKVTPNSDYDANYFWLTVYNADKWADWHLDHEREEMKARDFMSEEEYARYERMVLSQQPGYDLPAEHPINRYWGMMDIWEVKLPPDIPLKGDPYFKDDSWEKKEWSDPNLGIPGVVRYDGPIPPENMRVLYTKDIKEDFIHEPDMSGDNRFGATDHLWDERVTTKVIYDFDSDRLFLGTMADVPNLPSNKVIGEYADDAVEIFETEKQWVSPTYFKRLWYHSFPSKPLNGVYFRKPDGEKFRLDRIRKRDEGTGS